MDDSFKAHGKFKYVEKGEGPALLLLHGLFGALSNYKDVFDAFSGRYRVIIPLLPIYSLPVINTNVKNLAAFLHDFITYKKLNDVTLLGNSLGGHIALYYLTKHQDKVKSLILTGSSGLYENAMGSSFPRREDKVFLKKKIAETFYDPIHATDELVDECHTIVNDRAQLIRILAIAKSAIRHNMAKDIPKMELPTLLIWGRNDTITPPEVAEEFHTLFPNSELHWIDKCGHAPMMERPDQFNQLVSDWLIKQYAN
jgi:2-hydroxy-6-oxonona-2,4-dienedioate hydrolase